MNTSKSAFDFLMRNVKAKQQQQKPIEILATSSSDDDIIVLNEDFKKTNIDVLPEDTNRKNLFHITHHVRQFGKLEKRFFISIITILYILDENERNFFENECKQINFKLKKNIDTMIKIGNFKLGTFSNIYNTSNDCEVKNIFDCEEVRGFIF